MRAVVIVLLYLTVSFAVGLALGWFLKKRED